MSQIRKNSSFNNHRPIMTCEAIVLNIVDFRDTDQIATLFALDQGIVKLIVKGAHRRTKRPTRCSLSPLTRVDCTFKSGRGELMICEEVSVTQHFSHLRESLTLLEAGCQLVRLIEKSQMAGKPAPNLYFLLKSFLENLRETNVFQLTSSFELKVLRHEGMLALADSCSHCGELLGDVFISSGECYCARHALPGSIHFSKMERDELMLLAHSRSLLEIERVIGNSALWKKTSDMAGELFK